MNTIKESARNTSGSLILNFGEVVSPLAYELANLSSYIRVNQDCNHACALKCFHPMRGYLQGASLFDEECLDACQCHFDFAMLETEEAEAHFRRVMKQLQMIHEFLVNKAKDSFTD